MKNPWQFAGDFCLQPSKNSIFPADYIDDKK